MARKQRPPKSPEVIFARLKKLFTSCLADAPDLLPMNLPRFRGHRMREGVAGGNGKSSPAGSVRRIEPPLSNLRRPNPTRQSAAAPGAELRSVSVAAPAPITGRVRVPAPK